MSELPIDYVRDMGLRTQCLLVHERMRAKGFYDHEFIEVEGVGRVENPSFYEEKIALLHSEASEILDARRDGNEELEEEECADLQIRLMDYCGARNFDLGQAYIKKMKKNAERPRLHGRKR